MSLNVGGGVRLIKPAKFYMCTQIHYKLDEDGRTAPGVGGHGSVRLSHSGNVVTRIGLHTIMFTPTSSPHAMNVTLKKVESTFLLRLEFYPSGVFTPCLRANIQIQKFT